MRLSNGAGEQEFDRWRVNIRLLAASLGILVLVLLVLWAPVLDDSSWFIVLSDAAHAVVFGGVVLLCLIALKGAPGLTGLATWKQYSLAFAITLSLGVATELLQIPLQRDANTQDLLRDVLGAWIGTGAFALFDARLRRTGRLLAALTAFVPGLIVALPVLENSSAYLRRELAYPTIADFTAGFDDYFLRRQSVSLSLDTLPKAWSHENGEQALSIHFGDGSWPGLEFRELHPVWQGYRILAVDITNPDDRDLQLQLRVHDESHNGDYADRFNLALIIPAGERIVNRIPLALIEDGPRSRRLVLDEISTLILFVNGSEYPNREIYLSGIWLE